MPTLRAFAQTTPEKPACILANTGEQITYLDLDRNSNRLANLFDDLELKEGDRVAVMLDNDLRYCEIAFAARRRGLYYTPVSWHLTAPEVEFILKDCGAKIVFTNTAFLPKVEAARLNARVIVVDSVDPSLDYATLRDAQPDEVRETGRPSGKDLCYSSGTTGRPKGIRQPLRMTPAQDLETKHWLGWAQIDSDTVYLSPAPLYHAAPLRFVVRILISGGTAVITSRFDAEASLRFIEAFRVTHSQWVPTMLQRMLALPEDVRHRYDLSSHRVAIHAAAPCPPQVKDQILDWWGPILWEYYAGSEKVGATAIGPDEWMSHRGSVGKAKYGILHILDENQDPLPANQIGQVYIEGHPFEYLNDPAKTAAAHSKQGYATYGDVGYISEDGYLYLTDRVAHTIISGGVNIYPAETENALLEHPDVMDVCVFGIPNRDFGEEVKAAVQLRDPAMAGPEMELSLLQFCGERISRLKVPRSIDFHDRLPRMESGKLNKNDLRRPYLEKAAT